MPKNTGNNVTTKNLKLNAQWLKNAARTLGMNGISTIADISPNMAGVGRAAASSISTVTSAASNVRRQQRPIQYLLESNKYVKLGKRAIDNALSDLARGKFTNQDRSGGSDADFGSTRTGTYFGDMSDGSDGNEGAAATQNIYNIDTKAIDNVSNAVNTQTKYQLQMGKANIDTMVAIASSSMTQSQKNSDAILAQVSEMNRGIQALVAYQNENMTKYISASMSYYEAAGKSLGVGKEETKLPARSVVKDNGGLDVDVYKDRVKKQVVDQLKGSTAGLLLQMVADNAEDLANNPLEFVSKAVMDKAIPEVTKKAMKATDKIFGSFMTEMLLQMGDQWEADTSDSLLGKAKRFAAAAFGIKDKRVTKIDRSGKITTEAAVFDGATRSAIIDELPKYARESTAYLRAMVELLGGDPNSALRGSRILNRETGRYQSMETFASDFASSIDERVISAMNNSSFGKEMRNSADLIGKNEAQIEMLNKAIDKFFVAAEKNTKGSINVSDLSEGSDMSNLIKEAGLDPKMQEFIRRTIAGMVRNQTGIESFNEGRLKARRSRNTRIDEISGDNGLLRTTNLFRSGNSADGIDIAQITAESLLPQRGSGGIKLPGSRTNSIGDSVADALYGNSSARLIGSANPRNMAVGSVGARLKTIEDILIRGINVRIDNNPPWRGAEGVGTTSGFMSGFTGNSGGIILPGGANAQQENTTQSQNTNAENAGADIDLSDMDNILDSEMAQPGPATGKGSKIANTLGHAKQAMYLMMTGNASLAMNEMSTMLGETMSGVAGAAKKHILDPLRDAILPTKEVTDENGNTRTEKVTVLDMVKEKFSSVTNSVKETLLGKDDEGKVKSVSAVFKEGMGEWRKTIFGDKDPEEIKQEVQKRVPDAVGGAVGGGLIGMLVGGPVFGALLGGAAGFAKKSKWFQDMMFGEVDEAGNEVKKGLIPPSVKKYYDENKTELTGGAAVGGLLGMVVGGPVLGAAAGIGATILKKSDKFNELLFGKEETDEKTGQSKKVGGILNLFKEVGGHYWKGTSDDAKGLSAKAAVGVGGGLLMSLFTPIGPIGGAALGLAASIATNGDKFRQFLFGKKDENGNVEEAGLFQKMGNNITAQVINPLRDGVLDFFDKSKDKVIDKMLSPMLASLQPLLNFGGRIYEKTLGKIAEGAQKAAAGFGNMLKTVGKKLFDKTVGRAGRFAKRVAGAGVSLVTGTVGTAFKAAGSLAERSNRKASRKRFDKEDHRKELSQWEDEYYKDKDAQKKYTLEAFLEGKKERYYYNYGDKLKNYFGTKDERKAARAETDKRIANRKELRKQALLINELTGGKYSDTGATAKQAALDAYMQSKRYEKGKGINIKRYGKLSQEDILKMLTVDKSESSAISSAQSMIMDEQLQSQREAAGRLGQIYEWLESVGRKITGADDPERQQKRAERQDKKTQKRERKELARAEAQRRDEELEDRLNSSKDGSESSKRLLGRQAIEDKYKSMADKWKKAEDEILAGMKSKNTVIRFAAQDAYPAFFDDNGDRIVGTNVKDIIPIEAAKKKAWAQYQKDIESTKEDKKEKKQRTKLGSIRETRKLAHLKNYSRSQAENDLPHKANGGLTEEGVTVVGERGPEIVQFPDRARVLSGKSKIDVNLIGIAPDVLKAVGAETAVQDVRIVGQNGLLATYGTSAKLGSKTNNSGKIENALEDEAKLIRYDDVKQDNDDYEEQEERTPSLLEKLLGVFGGDGGILSKLGLIAGGAGLIALLSNGEFRELLKKFLGEVFGEDGVAENLNRELENGEHGEHTVVDPTTGDKKSVMDAETHVKKYGKGGLDPIKSVIADKFTSPFGWAATAKDAGILALGNAGAGLTLRGLSAIPTIAGGTMNLAGNGVKGVGGVLNLAGKAAGWAQALPARVNTAMQMRAAGQEGFWTAFLGSKGSVGIQGTGGNLMNAGAKATSAGTTIANAGTKTMGVGDFMRGTAKNMGKLGPQAAGLAMQVGFDVGYNTTDITKHRTLSGDYGMGRTAGGFTAESKTVGTVTGACLGIATTVGVAALYNVWHPGGWIMAIVAGAALIGAALGWVVNHLVGWIQDKSDREYSIRSNSAKLKLVIDGGVQYDDSAMNPRYVYCGQESDRVLGLDEGVYVGEADVCMANFLYTVKENLMSAPGGEVLLYDLINNMAVQGVPFACYLAGSSNICNAKGDHANSDFGEPYVTEDSGFLKSAKTQVTHSRVKKNIDTIMGDVSTNVKRNCGSDHVWNMTDLETVYQAGEEVNSKLTRAGILKDGKTVNTKLFTGAPGSGKNDSGWKSLDKLTRENGSYFLAKCLVYINSKIDAKDGKQWLELNQDNLGLLEDGLKDFFVEETGQYKEQLKAEGKSDEEIEKILNGEMDEEGNEIEKTDSNIAKTTGGISNPENMLYESVHKQTGIKAEDKKDISRELKFLTAAWAYSHPAELQRWVNEHPDESSIPKNYRNLITSWNDSKAIKDKKTREELRRYMLAASLEYAQNHGDIFGFLPMIRWDDSYKYNENTGDVRYGVYANVIQNEALQYGPGYIFRGRNKSGGGKLEGLFADNKTPTNTTPTDMHKILFGSKDENKGSEGDYKTEPEANGFWGNDNGIIGGIVNRIASSASESTESRYGKYGAWNMPDKILAGIPTNNPPYANKEETLVDQESGSSMSEMADDMRNGGGKGGRGNVIPFYSQKDPRWAGKPYDPNRTETMADAGCGPTALSMAINGAGGMGPSPTDVADRLQAIGARDNTGTSWNGMDRGISSYGLKSDQASNPGQNFVDSGISSGKPVILSGTSMDMDDPFTSQGHYVVVTGKDRDGNYVVNDPNESAPVTYSKEQVTRHAAKGWKVSGGRGHLRVIRGGGRPMNAVSYAAMDDGGGTTSATTDKIAEARNKWVSTVKAVKQAIAALKPGYITDANLGYNISITVGGRTIPARSDCSGMVSAALTLYGAFPEKTAFSAASYSKTSGDCANKLIAAGFRSSGWPGWDALMEGDIIARNGHVEIFCRNEGNTHYVYNCGSTSSVNNPGPTTDGGNPYTTVWRVGEPCAGGISNFDIGSGSASGVTYSNTATTDSNSSGGFLSKLASWATELGSRTLGWLTGSMSLGEATDWSSWKNGTSSSSTSTGYSDSGSADYSNTSVANLTGNTSTEKIWNHLRKNVGFDKNAAAAAMGCWQAESSNNPDRFEGDYLQAAKNYGGAPAVLASNASLNDYTQNVLFPAYARSNVKINRDGYRGTDGNYYPGFGLAQWTGPRGKALMDFAKQHNMSWRSLESQLGFFDYELENNKRGTVSTYNGFNTLEDATWNFMKKYEGVTTQQHYDNRIPSARAYYEMYANSEDTGSTSGGSTGGINTTSRPRNNISYTAMTGAGGRGGKGGTATPSQWKYNTATPVRGTSSSHGATIKGSSAPVNFTDHAITRQHQQAGGRGLDDTAIKLLEQIVQILGSSDSKLNNLQYLSELGSMTGSTTNNLVAIQNSNSSTQNTPNRNVRNMGVEKISEDAYRDARRIVAG